MKVYKYYWLDENGEPRESNYLPEEFPSEAAARTYAEALGQTCCDPGEHEWLRLASAWEEIHSQCQKCYLIREVENK